jgi:hypothetical protein
VNVARLVLMKYHKAPKQSLLQDFRWIVLTHSSKRFEKQIKDIQDKAETVKMEVCFVLSNHACTPYADSLPRSSRYNQLLNSRNKPQ